MVRRGWWGGGGGGGGGGGAAAGAAVVSRVLPLDVCLRRWVGAASPLCATARAASHPKLARSLRRPAPSFVFKCKKDEDANAIAYATDKTMSTNQQRYAKICKGVHSHEERQLAVKYWNANNVQLYHFAIGKDDTISGNIRVLCKVGVEVKTMSKVVKLTNLIRGNELVKVRGVGEEGGGERGEGRERREADRQTRVRRESEREEPPHMLRCTFLASHQSSFPSSPLPHPA